MKKSVFYILLTLSMVILTTLGCKKYLDVNSDPDTTQTPSTSSVLPQCLASIPTALEPDALLYVAKYIQNWLTGSSANANVWDQQGYSWSSGTAAATWQMTYFALGKNVVYMIENGEKEGQPEYQGVGYALQAWSYQHTTDMNSDIIFHDAYNPDLFSFRYEGQDTIYQGVDSICRTAIAYLNAAIALRGATSSILAKGDIVYNGDLLKWKRFVFGVLARNWGHRTNKTAGWARYNPDSVMAFCDSAMVSNTDDFDVPFDATQNGNSNYYGTFRDNLGNVRQSNFIVGLLDGTALAGSNIYGNRDPRLSVMLVRSPDTTNGNGGYRGVDPGQGDPYYSLSAPSAYTINSTNWLNARKKVPLFWGDTLATNPSASSFTTTGKYLFQNKAVFPVMTYSEMQFIKAEAALRKGDNSTAYQAYLNGINGHFNMINRDYSGLRGALPLYGSAPISTTARNAYLNGNSVRHSASDLHLTDIMLQKYISLWGWGFFETWVDLRRYHYITDLDPATGNPVYATFNLPVPIYSLNNGLTVQRIRPHFTSEYTYNISELRRVGALQNTYQTKEMWFSKSSADEGE